MSDDEEPKRRWTGKPASGGGERQMATRVKNKKVKESSRNWLKRQLNDPYVAKARAEGYRARAAYKLLELDEQFHFMKRGARVIDLGAAPGGWLQVAVARGASKVVGVDLLPIEPLPGAILFQMDLLAPETPGVLMEALGGQPDIVLSDMAANTTGHQRTDQIRTGALAEAAAEFAIDHCAVGGTFVTKAFQGGLDSALLARLKQSFASVRHAKPPASRAESSEIYVVAMGRKPV